ncbi:Uncharacterized protein ToN1_00120 [Aromatoleum petrolei]|nr:Uncharacterized protein ToN1_00120 [Aromatoleum petrolei]
MRGPVVIRPGKPRHSRMRTLARGESSCARQKCPPQPSPPLTPDRNSDPYRP